MHSYSITSKAGLHLGVYSGEATADALAEAHRDAGYDVEAENGALFFADEADRAICGDLDAWIIEQVVDDELAPDEDCKLLDCEPFSAVVGLGGLTKRGDL
jgi:hypothetical protein